MFVVNAFHNQPPTVSLASGLVEALLVLLEGVPESRRDARDAAETIAEGSMPPRRYLLIHRDANLSDAERRLLLDALEAMGGGDRSGRDGGGDGSGPGSGGEDRGGGGG